MTVEEKSVIIGLVRQGNTVEMISYLIGYPVLKVQQVIDEYFRLRPKP